MVCYFDSFKKIHFIIFFTTFLYFIKKKISFNAQKSKKKKYFSMTLTINYIRIFLYLKIIAIRIIQYNCCNNVSVYFERVYFNNIL